MNVLYLGGYKSRFDDVIKLINTQDKSIVELCFGDTYIAEYCNNNNIKWTGYDISEYFVKNAKNLGFDAYDADILTVKNMPKADACVIIGSFYHFEGETEALLLNMLDISSKIIISEPIKNLTNSNKLLSLISKKMTRAGNKIEEFRYDKRSIMEMLNKYSEKLHFSYKVVKENRDILILITHD